MRREISKIIKEWKDEAKVPEVIQVSPYSSTSKTITIFTSKPGWLIGKNGVLHNKYFDKLKEVNKNLSELKYVETDGWYVK